MRIFTDFFINSVISISRKIIDLILVRSKFMILCCVEARGAKTFSKLMFFENKFLIFSSIYAIASPLSQNIFVFTYYF